MQKRKNFIYRNEPFVCAQCGQENGLNTGEIRDHCVNCLCSLHVDLDVPGDRGAECGGIMTPQSITYNGKKGYMIHYVCVECGKTIVNKAASDDNFDLICQLSAKGHEAK